MNRQQFEKHREAVYTDARILSEVNTGCAGCDFFSRSDGHCAIHSAVVPEDFRAAGCDDWGYMEVPF
jgi:hypothetical protein